jgi:diguanylate cyclase (GGDEF)-like protein
LLQSAVNSASPPFPTRTISIGLGAMGALVLLSTLLNWRLSNEIHEVVGAQAQVLEAAHQVEHFGTVLETSIKAVVDRGDAEAAATYRAVQPQLRTVLTSLRDQVGVSGHRRAVVRVDRADLDLIAIEYSALDLVAKGEVEAARRLIYSDRYARLVEVYVGGIDEVQRLSVDFVRALRARLDRFLLLIVLLSAASMVLVVLGWLLLIRPARRWGHALDQARHHAEMAKTKLEAKQGELEILNRRLFEEARTDPLTGLYTRLKFNEDIADLWPRIERRTESYCAMMCDVDFFKQYNDNYGHIAGDAVLRRVTAALDGTRRGGDQLYRMGGEEFLIILHGCKARDAAGRAEHFRAAVEALDIPHAASPLGHVTLSIGSSCVGPGRSITLQAWLGEADAAMYEAKAAGRNAVVTRETLAA